MGRLDGIRWVSTANDPGILAPFRGDRKSFARLVWGGPWIRPVNYPFGPNPWNDWRWATIRLRWFALPFLSLRIGKLLFYVGAKTYRVGALTDHTYARPEEVGVLVGTFSVRWGMEPLR